MPLSFRSSPKPSRPVDAMVRPRFAKLSPQQQQAILGVALDEFAAHGFHGASLNRVIQAAGISKGSMYYYFDDKDDLYAYVARTELAGLFVQVGPLPPLDSGGADAFWSSRVPGGSGRNRAEFAPMDRAGSRRGKMRGRSPRRCPGLLIAVVLGMGEAMDLWLMSQQTDDGELPRLIAVIMSMIRGAVSA